MSPHTTKLDEFLKCPPSSLGVLYLSLVPFFTLFFPYFSRFSLFVHFPLFSLSLFSPFFTFFPKHHEIVHQSVTSWQTASLHSFTVFYILIRININVHQRAVFSSTIKKEKKNRERERKRKKNLFNLDSEKYKITVFFHIPFLKKFSSFYSIEYVG